MRQLVKLLLLSVLLCLIPPAPLAQKSKRRTRSRSTPHKTVLLRTDGDATSSDPASTTRWPRTRVAEDDSIARAFANGTSGIQVKGEGTVIRVLQDDVNGPRHQRFILQLASGQTLLITHNIDIAPRIQGLQVGDSVRFSGEYIWNAKGGVIHWMHHDPGGSHVAGWLLHQGKTYK